ncbi:RecB-like helicase [Campylobacter upsaliensis]|uniref:RecB-like helicase n=1 Tax=Campylobacter upsaliensis TaxID=28080 RepID=UPI002149CA0A|nr:RecB-like helicase [Campylobacter upsaliensis]MCR2098310.1 RecB-like helicase [Campylobacter upsaliensis]
MSEFKPFLALEASAGSGKTFALSMRFVALILNGAKIDEILAITFTKKATNEMKKRVIENFLTFDKKEAEMKELCKLLGKDKEELIRLRDAEKEEFLRKNLKIYTFDALFSQILRSFALNLGLMSDFESVENSQDVRRAFLKKLSKEELKKLATYILKIDEKEHFFNELESLYQNAYFKNLNITNQPGLSKLQSAYDDLRKYCLSFDNEKLKNNFKSEKLHLKEFLKSPIIDQFEEKKYLRDLAQEDVNFTTKRERFLESLRQYALELENFKITNLMGLLKIFIEAKNDLHKNKNILSFSDISRRVLDLIRSDLKDMIYFRLDGRISHLLIDEFQDTSVVQYEILKPIIAELVSGEGVKKNRSFFYVGDKKQSIYRFRNSKKELFDLLRNTFTQIKTESLDTNYRSLGYLIEFVNTQFKNKFENFIPQKILEQNQNKGFVRIVQSEEKDAKKTKQELLKVLKEQLDFLHQKGVLYEKICILCWQNNDANEILEYLKEHKIPAFTQSNILLENKASVRLVLEYAKYCIFGDAFYLEVMREFLDFEPERLQLDLAKSPEQNMLYLIKNLKLDLADIALLQFLEYAKQKGNFMELLFNPCPLKMIDEENYGISIMTVHKSKGLEFDYVVVLDRLSKGQNDNEQILLEYDIQKGWELRIKNAFHKAARDASYQNFLARIEKAQKDDDINKLYVALTRAKNGLIVIKKNPFCVNGNNPSYFNGKGYLNLECCEIGTLNEQTAPKNEEQKEQNALKEFVKIPLQNVEKIELKEEFHFGNAFHFCMQGLKLPKGENLEHIKQKAKDKFRHFLSEDEFNTLFKRVQNLLENKDFQALLQGKKLLKEQPLSFNGELKRLDLLAFDEKEALIIDYKTGEFNAKNAEQITLYKQAIKEILNKQNTRAFLIYCQDAIQILEN